MSDIFVHYNNGAIWPNDQPLLFRIILDDDKYILYLEDSVDSLRLK